MDDNTGLLSEITARIRDQRYLVLLAAAIILGVFSFYSDNPYVGILVFIAFFFYLLCC